MNHSILKHTIKTKREIYTGCEIPLANVFCLSSFLSSTCRFVQPTHPYAAVAVDTGTYACVEEFSPPPGIVAELYEGTIQRKKTDILVFIQELLLLILLSKLFTLNISKQPVYVDR